MSSNSQQVTGLYAVADRIVRFVEIAAAAIAAVMLFVTMVLISADAVLRYTLNQPLAFQLTLTENILLVGLVMLSLAWGFRTGGYVRINAVAHFLPPLARSVLLRVGLLTSAAYVATLCYKSWDSFWHALVRGTISFGVIDYPIWLSYVWVPFGLGLLSLRLLLIAVGPTEDLDAHGASADEL